LWFAPEAHRTMAPSDQASDDDFDSSLPCGQPARKSQSQPSAPLATALAPAKGRGGKQSDACKRRILELEQQGKSLVGIRAILHTEDVRNSAGKRWPLTGDHKVVERILKAAGRAIPDVEHDSDFADEDEDEDGDAAEELADSRSSNNKANAAAGGRSSGKVKAASGKSVSAAAVEMSDDEDGDDEEAEGEQGIPIDVDAENGDPQGARRARAKRPPSYAEASLFKAQGLARCGGPMAPAGGRGSNSKRAQTQSRARTTTPAIAINVTIKITNPRSGLIHRIETESISFKGLCVKIRALFGYDDERSLGFKFEDDEGDECAIVSDAELREAIGAARERQQMLTAPSDAPNSARCYLKLTELDADSVPSAAAPCKRPRTAKQSSGPSMSATDGTDGKRDEVEGRPSQVAEI